MAIRLLKDDVLAKIAKHGGNVARHVSFDPQLRQRNGFVHGVRDRKKYSSPEEAAGELMAAGAEYVNIRCFHPGQLDGNPFIMGRHGYPTAEKIGAKVRAIQDERIAEGEPPYYFILNEEIDVMDGGFSGVLHGNVAEFAPASTPRCVEKAGCAIMPRHIMARLIQEIYGFRFGVPYGREHRVEFSIHPNLVGLHRTRTIIWQVEKMDREVMPSEVLPTWPNKLSEVVGDKPFGLHMAHLFGLPVPYTQVVGRLVKPYSFGIPTGSESQQWFRTCPSEQQPGVYTTSPKWMDPFKLFSKEDPEHKNFSSFVWQDNVDAEYAGACITDAEGIPVVEGVSGYGDAFMVSERGPEPLPEYVIDSVLTLWEQAHRIFGAVRFEWVYDQFNTAWIVQFHRGGTDTQGDIIVPGDADEWVTYNSHEVPIAEFRDIAPQAARDGIGIILETSGGVTNHYADQLRRNRVPSRRVCVPAPVCAKK